MYLYVYLYRYVLMHCLCPERVRKRGLKFSALVVRRPDLTGLHDDTGDLVIRSRLMCLSH